MFNRSDGARRIGKTVVLSYKPLTVCDQSEGYQNYIIVIITAWVHAVYNSSHMHGCRKHTDFLIDITTANYTIILLTIV